jgi:hypothetical protein
VAPAKIPPFASRARRDIPVVFPCFITNLLFGLLG